MASRTIPTIPQADVESHNTSKSCYVTLGNKVYDITPFLADHPGGGELIVEYGGKDVSKIMADEVSHTHSESAYEVLDDHFVGFVAGAEIMDVVTDSSHPDEIVPLPPTSAGMAELRQNGAVNGSANGHLNGNGNGHLNGNGNGHLNGLANGKKVVYATTGMSSAEDLSKDTDVTTDYKTHKFLNLDRPLFPQIWYGGFSKNFYLEQVHRPRHYKGGASAPLFGNFLEPLTKTPWWVVPMIWLPLVSYGTILAGSGLGNPVSLVLYWITGLCIWTLVEYGLHRCLFHLDNYLPDNRVAITAHFLLHGIHHYLPMDRLRLVMPPTLFIAIATPFWHLAHTVFFYNWYAAVAVFSGGVFGYICYDLTHYFLHHRKYVSAFSVSFAFLSFSDHLQIVFHRTIAS